MWKNTVALPSCTISNLPNVKLWSAALKPESSRGSGHIRFLMFWHRPSRLKTLRGPHLNFLCLIQTPGLVEDASSSSMDFSLLIPHSTILILFIFLFVLKEVMRLLYLQTIFHSEIKCYWHVNALRWVSLNMLITDYTCYLIRPSYAKMCYHITH